MSSPSLIAVRDDSPMKNSSPRFAGPEIEWKPRTQHFGAGSDPSNIVDAGYAVGSIQIPGGKGPIVLPVTP